MKYRPLPHAAAHVAAACAFMLLACAPAARAQPPPPAEPAQQDSFNRRDMRDREAALRTRARAENKPAYEPNPELRLAQIKEDYERIQSLNNDLRRASADGPTPDYKRIAAAAADVRKRAARLKANLAFPEPDDDAAPARKEPNDSDNAADEEARVKASLKTLDELVVSFVTNPVFQSVALDAPQAARASRDLVRLIELSAEIRKTAERLAKSRAKSK